MKLNSFQLRRTNVALPDHDYPRQDIYIILDNVLDTYNIGAIFRLADAVAVRKIYLCGETPIPPNHRITKASVNTWRWVAWEHAATTIDAITYLRRTVPKIKIIAVELTDSSIPYAEADYGQPLALIVGHETTGVSTETLALVDQTIQLPMLGVNTSLNVMVSLGIVLYRAIGQVGQK